MRSTRPDARAAVVQALIAAPEERTLEDVAARVAATVAQVEPRPDRERWREAFADWIGARAFLPNLPTLANARPGGQLAACFVLEPDDSLRSIYTTLTQAALIQQGAGGTGINFSNLRARGEQIERSGGATPGPVGFLELFAHSAQVNCRAGRRPGAHLAVLRDDHPDIVEFVRAKRARPRSLDGVGLAVTLRDAVIEAAERGDPIELRDARGRVRRRLGARELLGELAESMHATGEPSILFIDTIERANPVPGLGPIRATNPCGEQPLLPGESCVLGSLHLPAFLGAGDELDWARLGTAVDDAVRFLDDVIDANQLPDPEIGGATLRTRKIGIGVMGFADLLLLRGVSYGGRDASALAHRIAGFLRARSRAASESLAQERGAFPAWDGRGTPRRNAITLSIAPTGTLRLIAGCSGGIEPFLEPVLRVVRGSETWTWVDRWLESWAAKRASDPEALIEALRVEAPSAHLPGIDDAARDLLRRGWEIDPERQIALQAAFQRHVDGAVSKTVHVPSGATRRELARLIAVAHRRGCKGLALFRRGCGGVPAPLEAGFEVRLPDAV